MRVVCTAYPNNEFRLRVVQSGRPAAWARQESWADEPKQEKTSGPLGLLDITSEVETFPQRVAPGWGMLGRRTKFGRNAKNTLLRAGGALEKEGYQPGETVFLTGTIPGSTREAFCAIAEWSSFAVHKLKAFIAKRVRSKLDFYVWELQKRGALHLHYAVVVPGDEDRAYILRKFRGWWEGILDEIAKRSGVDVWARGDGSTWADDKSVLQAYAQEVKKGVGQYLAKYCGKDSGKGNADDYYPARWWGVSRPLLELMRKHTQEIELHERGFQRCRETFTTLWETLKSLGAKGYRYARDKGSGMFAVMYCAPKEWSAIIDEVRRELTGTKHMRSGEFVYRSRRLREEFQSLASRPENWAIIGSNLSEPKLQVLTAWAVGGYFDEWAAFEAVYDAMWQIWDYCERRGIMFSWARNFISAALGYLEALQKESWAVKTVLEVYPNLAINEYSKGKYLSVSPRKKSV